MEELYNHGQGVEVKSAEGGLEIRLENISYSYSPSGEQTLSGVRLDEPTAALDVTAEFQIYSLIQKRVKDKGVLFISHRLSVCQIVDEILVFENGNVVQRGTHKKLLETENGLYSRMWKAQAEVYVE